MLLFVSPVLKPGIPNDLDGRIPVIDKGTPVPVDFGQGSLFGIGVKTEIAHRLADTIALLLFHKASIVFAGGDAPGELDTPGKKLLIDELPVVIAVHTQRGKGTSAVT